MRSRLVSRVNGASAAVGDSVGHSCQRKALRHVPGIPVLAQLTNRNLCSTFNKLLHAGLRCQGWLSRSDCRIHPWRGTGSMQFVHEVDSTPVGHYGPHVQDLQGAGMSPPVGSSAPGPQMPMVPVHEHVSHPAAKQASARCAQLRSSDQVSLQALHFLEAPYIVNAAAGHV